MSQQAALAEAKKATEEQKAAAAKARVELSGAQKAAGASASQVKTIETLKVALADEKKMTAGYNPICYNPICYNPMCYNPICYNPICHNPTCYNPICYG